MAGQAGLRALLMAIYDLMRWGPTAANITPARIVFVMSHRRQGAAEAASGRRQSCEKTMAAPATAIIGYDLDFARNAAQALSATIPKPQELVHRRASQTLVAWRCAMAACRAAISSWRRGRWGWIAGRWAASTVPAWTRNFSPAPQIKSNFLCNLGYGDPAGVLSRAMPRLAFDEACKISSEAAGSGYRAGRLFGGGAGR